MVYEMPVDDVDAMQDVESSLLLTHAQLIADYDKVLDDHAEHVCCSVNDCTKENQFLESNSLTT